jgi:hypothetical protein
LTVTKAEVAVVVVVDEVEVGLVVLAEMVVCAPVGIDRTAKPATSESAYNDS